MIFCFNHIKLNEFVNKVFLASDEFMPEMYLKQPGLLIVPVIHLLKRKKELQNLCRHEIQILFTKMVLIKLVFNLIWLTVNQKIEQKELNQTKF